jgi:hypothetical protein
MWLVSTRATSWYSRDRGYSKFPSELIGNLPVRMMINVSVLNDKS